MHKAKLCKKLKNKTVICTSCQRYCQIGDGKMGFCQFRENRNGILYSKNYGYFSGICVDPIEKKPFYHFHPGTEVLSLGSWGCNFRCKQCQNWHCSWGAKEVNINNYISPKNLVTMAKQRNLPGIAFTYNEPVIWPEFVHDAAKLAKVNGLYTVFVSNGSWSQESLAYYGKYIDAANIDLKGWGEKVYQKQGAYFGQIPQNLILAFKKYKIHLELTTLVIPDINDSCEQFNLISNWIVSNLSPDIPWHLLRFFPKLSPDKDFCKLATTPLETLKKAQKIAKKNGLTNVYI